MRAADEKIVTFTTCPEDCFRLKKFGVTGPDHFVTPSGKPRHLFSKPGGDEAWLNREYVPHIAAYAFALGHGYDAKYSTFSLYRKFTRDLIARRSGATYETDAEFYDGEGAIHLQIEAKASPAQTARLAAAIEAHGTLKDLPTSAAKEVEYVLDLSPRYLWVVGPGSIEPSAHVYAVEVNGLNAVFEPVSDLPASP